MVVVLAVLCALLLVAAVLLALRVRFLTTALSEANDRTDRLEADLASALRPPPPTTTTERALRRMIRTAREVRDRGIGGLIQSTVEDITSWASEERAEVVHMAAADGTVTLFFSDIEDSTAFNDKLGDETWVRVLAAHDQLLRTRIAQFRGQVVKTAGDGFMVAFRDAEAACRAALWIQDDLRRPAEPTLRRHGPIKVRIGVHTGQVVEKEGDYFGRNVAMAARVADLARGGEVMASDAVREALDDDAAVALEEMETVALKGLAGDHVVWRVVPTSN